MAGQQVFKQLALAGMCSKPDIQRTKCSLYTLSYSAVYNLLGERSYGMDIFSVEVDNLSTADPNDVYKIEEMPDIIGLRKSSLTVDDKGRLLGMG